MSMDDKRPSPASITQLVDSGNKTNSTAGVSPGKVKKHVKLFNLLREANMLVSGSQLDREIPGYCSGLEIIWGWGGWVSNFSL